MRTSSSRQRTTTSERGSAYIVALLALLVLTIGGLSVALVTQTEMQIGVNERVLQRSFYSAESGLALASSYLLTVGGACTPTEPSALGGTGWDLVTDSETRGPNSELTDVVRVPPALVLVKACCNWCPCQEGQSDEIHRFNYGLLAESERRAWDGAGAPTSGYAVLSRRALGMVLDIQPFHASEVVQCLNPDPDVVRRYKF